MGSGGAAVRYRTPNPRLTDAPAGRAMNWAAPRVAARRGASNHRPRHRLARARAPTPWHRPADLAMPLTCSWPLARAALPAPAQPARGQRSLRPVSVAGMTPATQAASAGPARVAPGTRLSNGGLLFSSPMRPNPPGHADRMTRSPEDSAAHRDLLNK